MSGLVILHRGTTWRKIYDKEVIPWPVLDIVLGFFPKRVDYPYFVSQLAKLWQSYWALLCPHALDIGTLRDETRNRNFSCFVI
jgi:hypothetical protein